MNQNKFCVLIVDELWIKDLVQKSNPPVVDKIPSLQLENLYIVGMSVTYQPKKRKRKKTHGFLARQRKSGGRAVLRRRRQKGRKRIAV